MNVIDELEKIKKWISDNHEHHSVMICADGDFPYVNSLELMAQLDRLIMELEERD